MHRLCFPHCTAEFERLLWRLAMVICLIFFNPGFPTEVSLCPDFVRTLTGGYLSSYWWFSAYTLGSVYPYGTIQPGHKMVFGYCISFFSFSLSYSRIEKRGKWRKKETGEGPVCLTGSKGNSHSIHLCSGDANGQCVFVESNWTVP